MIWRLVGLAQIVLAVLLAAAAAGLTVWAEPEVGVAVAGRDTDVIWVLPGGPSWRDGIRSGQKVVDFQSGVDPRSWRLETTDGSLMYGTGYPSQVERLREALPMALVGLALGLVGLLLIRRIIVASGFAAISLMFSAGATVPSGFQLLGSMSIAAALLVPIGWLLAWGPRRPLLRLALISLACMVGAAWLVGRQVVPDLFDIADYARQATTVGADLAVALVIGDLRQWRRRLLSLDSRRAADIVAVVAVLGVGLLLWLAFALPVAIVLIAVAGTILLYPGFRRGLAVAIDELLLGEVRDRASVKAVEDERSRIARDLHDAPLQDIAAVIRQLDGRADTTQQTALLRTVADRLRHVTTELRPPILDDLGLRAAIAYLGDRAIDASPDLRVEVSLVPDDPLAARPPAEVELAIFRILREAVDNALHHAAAGRLRITATVLPREVDAVIEDDGHGIGPNAAREAARAGHFGLVSMGQRAGLIGAEFAIERAAPHGTRVRISWRARE